MSYSLWRGDMRLGNVVAQLPTSDPRLFSGLLRPAPDAGGLHQSMQVRMPEFVRGRPVFSHDPGTAPKGGPYELRPLSATEALGLGEDEQLSLRDAKDQIVETDMITLERHAVPKVTGEYPDFCRAHGFDETAWVLVVRGPDLTDLTGGTGHP